MVQKGRKVGLKERANQKEGFKKPPENGTWAAWNPVPGCEP